MTGSTPLVSDAFGSGLENGVGSFQGHLDPVRTVPSPPARISPIRVEQPSLEERFLELTRTEHLEEVEA
jgi:hypothetical protein